MPVVILRLIDFQTENDGRPDHCPYCGSEVLQRWGPGTKNVQDANVEVSAFYRYRCSACEHTFRSYPSGVDHTKLTLRIRQLAAMCWGLGLSARQVVTVFKELGIELSHMTVWRDGHEFIDRIQATSDPDRRSRYMIDKLFLKNKSRGIGTTIVLDLGEGKTLVLGKIDEVNPRLVINWLTPFIKDMDIEVSLSRTDILSEYPMP